MHPGQAQAVLDLLREQGALALEAHPGRPMAAGARRAHGLDHDAEQLVADRRLGRARAQAGALRGLEVAGHGLAVAARQATDLPHGVAPQPQPEHLPDLHHGHLPVGHAAPPVVADVRCCVSALRSWRSREREVAP